jgi:hypothetical protein
MLESQRNEVDLQEWEPTVFVDVMKFIYSDQVFFSSASTLEYLWEIFLASKYFGVERMSRLCEQFISKEKLSMNNVCQLWKSASDYQAEQVELACIRFCEQKFEQVCNTPGFVSLPKELFLHILGSDELQITSVEILTQAALVWAKNHLRDVSPQEMAERRRLLFGEIYPRIRTPRKWDAATFGLLKTRVSDQSLQKDFPIISHFGFASLSAAEASQVCHHLRGVTAPGLRLANLHRRLITSASPSHSPCSPQHLR